MVEDKNSIVDRLTAVQSEIASVLQAISMDRLHEFLTLFADTQNRLFFTGQGRSGLVARMAAMRFMHLGYQTHFVGEVTAPSIREGDRIVVISGSGNTPVSLSYAQIAREEGAIVGAITSSHDGKLSGLAHFALRVPTDHTDQFGGSLFEQSSLILLDSIISILASTNPNALSEMAHRHTNLQ